MRTSPNIWLVFDGLRERTRKVPAAWREKRIHGRRNEEGKEWKGGEEDPKRGMREEDRGDGGAC